MDYQVAVLVCLVGAVAMAVVGWFVQLVQYPMFRHLPAESFHQAHRGHTLAIGFIVVPFMLAEGIGMARTWAEASGDIKGLATIGLASGAFAILWTFAVSAPLHGKLADSFDLAVVNRLIRTNLPRTLAWTLHATVQSLIVCELLNQGRA